VPWCASCDRFYNPNTLNTDGTCPAGHQVASTPAEGAGEAPPEKLRRFSDEPAPWHFKVLVAATAVYLGWRALQGLDWVAHHL
jgi:hypothetical protein